MTVFTKFSLRFAVYLCIVAYLIIDLFLINGPINRRINSPTPINPNAVARVFGHIITRSQLDRAIIEHLWVSGKTQADFENFTPEQKEIIQYAALGELIDHELLRVKVAVNSHKLTVTDKDIDERLKRFVETFPSAAELKSAMQSQGIPEEASLRNRIAARIQQEKYVAMRVEPLVTVTDEEISAFYEKNKDSLQHPPRIRARHIFIPTLNTPSDTAKQSLEEALAEIKNTKADFSAVAKKLSQDPATSSKGGELGWMSRKRLPKDFSEAVFDLPKNEPTLVRTKLGWHIVEVTDTKPAELPPLESIRDEIRNAIATAKRRQATIDFRTELRRFEKEKINIYHDRISTAKNQK